MATVKDYRRAIDRFVDQFPEGIVEKRREMDAYAAQWPRFVSEQVKVNDLAIQQLQREKARFTDEFWG